MMKKILTKAMIIIAMLLVIQCTEFIFKELVWEFIDEYIRDINIDINDITYFIAGVVIDASLIKHLFDLGKKFFTKKIEKAE